MLKPDNKSHRGANLKLKLRLVKLIILLILGVNIKNKTFLWYRELEHRVNKAPTFVLSTTYATTPQLRQGEGRAVKCEDKDTHRVPHSSWVAHPPPPHALSRRPPAHTISPRSVFANYSFGAIVFRGFLSSTRRPT